MNKKLKSNNKLKRQFAKLTTRQLEKAMIQYQFHQKIISLRTSQIEHEIDFLVVTKQNKLIEYELKVSRADFFQDRKKLKHNRMLTGAKGKIYKFYYVVPEGMVDKDEVPDYAGLVYVRENLTCRTIKRAKKLTDHELSQDDQTKIYRSIMYRWITQQLK